MAKERVLILEGGGDSMGALKTCRRWKTVYSPALGKRVKRCADFKGMEDDLMGIEELGLGRNDYIPDMDDIMRVSVAGISGVLGNMLIPRIPDMLPVIKNLDPRLKAIATLLLGIAGGRLVGNLSGNDNVETGVVVGVAVKAVQDIVAGFLGPGVSGFGLVTTERPEFPVRRSLGLVSTEPVDEFASQELSVGFTPYSIG
jgi:hypothetical protein